MLWLLACLPDSKPAPTVDASPTPVPPSGALVIIGVTTVDATGVQPDRDVILADGHIWDVRATGGAYDDVQVLAGADRFLVPGLVDAHVHLAHSGATVWTGDPLDANLRANVYHGVLAVYDVGGPDVLFDLRDAIDAGTTLGPTMHATGVFVTAIGSHPCETWPDPDLCLFVDAPGTHTPGAIDATDAAAQRAAAGADAIKVALADAAFTPWPTPRLDLDALTALTAGALPVIAHIDADADVIDAADAGVTLLAHPPFAAPIGAAALDATMRVDGVHSTVGAFGAVGDVLAGITDLDDPALILGPGVRDNWTFVAQHPDVLEPGWADASAIWATTARENLVAMHAAGATILPGSDAGYYFVPHGVGLHRELAELVAEGWTPTEALIAATLTARSVLGFEGGTVTTGEPADLLLLSADPTLDVGALDQIETVILRGVAYPREELRTVDLQTVGAAPCLEDPDCAANEACDGLAHRCAPTCAPIYDAYGSCDAATSCIPADGVTADVGVCHAPTPCDLYTQDCAPDAYDQACVPADADTNQCWYGGPRQVGDPCTWTSADDACAPGLFCSSVTATCYELCDPDAADDPCPALQRCIQQEAEAGVPWFGLCL